MKSEHPLNISFEKKGEINDQQIEPMILIPIVENCFKHCDFNENPDAFIEIRLGLDHDILYFYTKNSKNDADKQKDRVGGVGLENIKKRLKLNAEHQHELNIQDKQDYFAVNLKIKTRR